MRLWIFSDLHVEFSPQWRLPLSTDDFDVIIAAGDIHSPTSAGVRWLAEQARGKPVIYVPGNHEWYTLRRGFNVADERKRAADLAVELGVHLLEDSEVVIDQVRFLGATLWTDYALDGNADAAERVAEHGINDHRYIFPTSDMAPLRAREARRWHDMSRTWLTERLTAPCEQPATVVVAHHAPHPGSIHPSYAGSPYNPAFASDLSELVDTSGALLWVHGHTHNSFDYRVGKTRVVCNPKGYGRASANTKHENPAFDCGLVLDLVNEIKAFEANASGAV